MDEHTSSSQQSFSIRKYLYHLKIKIKYFFNKEDRKLNKRLCEIVKEIETK